MPSDKDVCIDAEAPASNRTRRCLRRIGLSNESSGATSNMRRYLSSSLDGCRGAIAFPLITPLRGIYSRLSGARKILLSCNLLTSTGIAHARTTMNVLAHTRSMSTNFDLVLDLAQDCVGHFFFQKYQWSFSALITLRRSDGDSQPLKRFFRKRRRLHHTVSSTQSITHRS